MHTAARVFSDVLAYYRKKVGLRIIVKQQNSLSEIK
jgi:hypothetical protein